MIELKVKPFGYDIVYLHNNVKERVEGAIVVVPNGWRWEDTGEFQDIVVFTHDEEGKHIGFKTIEDAQNYIDRYRDDFEFEWYRDELHAFIKEVR